MEKNKIIDKFEEWLTDLIMKLDDPISMKEKLLEVFNRIFDNAISIEERINNKMKAIFGKNK